MPTENRSSNTELSKIVTEALVGMVTGVTGMKPPADEPMPGFIQAPIDRAVTRISGLLAQPAPQPHPEPIAWMVGTAFWWTKEEAERDAAATGKTITPFGPMIDTGEVERLSATCAANIRARDEAIAEGRRYMGQASALDAALRELLADDIPLRVAAKIEAALSASAEPEAPQSEPGKPRRCTSCDNCQGFNTGHDSTQQKPYSIRCDNCHKEARAADHTGLARAWNALNQGE